MTVSRFQPIVILISGSGSNMVALLDAARRLRWSERWSAVVVGVVSNRPNAAGLAKAAARGIATEVVDHTCFDGREAFDQALIECIDAMAPMGARPPLVILAGFMRILTPAFASHFKGRLLNIHPSLLPAFPGLRTHQRAIEMGCRYAGATVHEVTAELDHGTILEQAVVPVLPEDTPDTLAARVLTQEHRIYPRAVEAWLARQAKI